MNARLLAMLLLLPLVGCTSPAGPPRSETPTVAGTRAADFELKVKCASYNALVEARLTMAPNSPMSKVLNSIFYSPVRNSCVVAYSIGWNDIDAVKTFGITYVLEDVLTRESIFSVNSTKSKTAIEDFEAKKSELKVVPVSDEPGK